MPFARSDVRDHIVRVAKDFTRNCRNFSSAWQPLPLLTSPLELTACCSQGQIWLLKPRRIA
jgi:hypothetical protein